MFSQRQACAAAEGLHPLEADGRICDGQSRWRGHSVLFDLKARDWSDEVLSALDIPRAWMPRTFEGTEFTGRVTEEAARSLA
jgi:sugar (pentulose or hexulose) kinase